MHIIHHQLDDRKCRKATIGLERLVLLIVFFNVFVMRLSVAESSAQSQPSDSTDTISKLIVRLAALQNIEVQCDLEISKTPLPNMIGTDVLPDGHKIIVQNEKSSFQRYFSFLKGKAFFKEEPSDETLAKAKRDKRDVPSRTDIFTEDRVETLSQHSTNPRPAGAILDHRNLPYDSFIDVALGLRLYKGSQWLTPDELRRAEVKAVDDKTAVVELKGTNGWVHRWTIDVIDPLTPTSYSLIRPTGELNLEFQLSNFEEHGGIRVPMRIVAKAYSIRKHDKGEASDLWVNDTETAVVKEYRVGDPTNTVDRYEMVWPKDSGLVDDRIGMQIHVTSGDRKITDRDIFNQTLKGATRPSSTEPTK